MSQIYCIDIPPTAITTAVDLAEITPGDDRTVEFVAGFIFQTTELGDAAEEILPLQLIRGYTSGGSGGSTVTPRPLKRNAQATPGMTAKVMNTTLATGGSSPHTLLTDGWNVRVPWVFHPVDEEEYPDATQADTTLVLRIPTAPIDSITMRGSVWVREN